MNFRAIFEVVELAKFDTTLDAKFDDFFKKIFCYSAINKKKIKEIWDDVLKYVFVQWLEKGFTVFNVKNSDLFTWLLWIIIW